MGDVTISEEASRPPRLRSEPLGSGGIRVLAPAKLNLFFELVSKRSDGYHNVSTVMQTVDLSDELVLHRKSSGIDFASTGLDVPKGQENIVWRAADLILRHSAPSIGVQITLLKRIPPGSGLGGGSSDAAATLVGLNRLLGLGIPAHELRRLAAMLGSDVPFFVHGGTALCEGRGEIITPVKAASPLDYVVVCPPISISTGEVYARSKIGLTGPRRKANILLHALEKGSAKVIGGAAFNRLESICVAIYPSLLELKETMASLPLAGVAMTGSGSAFFGICCSRREVREAAASLRDKGVGQVFSTRTWL